MNWPLTIAGLVLVGALVFSYVYTRRMLLRYMMHLEGMRAQLERRFHQRRNLVPSFIALGAGVPGLGQECLETLDNAAELVFRSKGFEERLLSENRLSSALYYVRTRLEKDLANVMPDLVALISELDEREAGIRVAAGIYNGQVKDFAEYIKKIPYRWVVPLCALQPPPAVDVRLSSSPVPSRRQSRKQAKENQS